jgi:hypothetical protein
MAENVEVISGVLTRKVPNSTSAGAADAAKMIQLNSAGKLDVTLMPSAALNGSEDYVIIAFETLAAGDLVNVFNNAGTASLRKADATDATKPPMGYVQAGVTAGATGTARLGNGVITGLAGLTIGARYYASAATPGGLTLTPPTVAGNVVYPVGRAKAVTEFAYVDDATSVVLG